MIDLVEAHAPERRLEINAALESELTGVQADLMQRLAQSELLRTGLGRYGEPTERGLLLEEIIDTLYRQSPQAGARPMAATRMS